MWYFYCITVQIVFFVPFCMHFRVNLCVCPLIHLHCIPMTVLFCADLMYLIAVFKVF